MISILSINGCGMCMEAHVHEVTKGGIAKPGVQSAVRISAVLQAAAQVLVHDWHSSLPFCNVIV